MIYTCTMMGDAMAQGSKRLGRNRGTGRPMLLDANPAFKTWRYALSTFMAASGPGAPMLGPVFVRLVIFVKRPEAHFGTGRNAGVLKASAPQIPATGLDTDKCLRAVYDAGTDAGWWRNDSQCSGMVLRLYSDKPRLDVRAAAWAAPIDLVELLLTDPELRLTMALRDMLQAINAAAEADMLLGGLIMGAHRRQIDRRLKDLAQS